MFSKKDKFCEKYCIYLQTDKAFRMSPDAAATFWHNAYKGGHI